MADFRTDTITACKQVCRQFTLLCKELDLFGGALLASDGSKFKAVNSQQRHFTNAKRQEARKHLDAQIEHDLHELHTTDQEEAAVQKPTAEELRENIGPLRARQGRDEGLKTEMEARGASQVSLTDPESRAMPKSPNVDVGDNVQVAVAAKPHLMVAQAVPHAITDVEHLRRMALQATEALGVAPVQVVADMGDSHGDAINACEDAGLEPYVAKPLTSAHRKLGLYGTERFSYEPEHDDDRCPAGQILTCRVDPVARGRHLRDDATTACQRCELKAQCPRHKAGRRMPRWVQEDVRERRQDRLQANPVLMKQRQHLVEPPFGPIKHGNDHGSLLMKGLAKVRADMRLSALADHSKRVMNSLGVPTMVAARA
jgi:hypothetical protein